MLRVNLPKEKAFCDLPFTRMKIDHLGNVLHCCFQNKHFGNILNDEFRSIWKGEIAEDIRQHILNEQLHPTCKGWLGCPYINKKLSSLERKEVFRSLPVDLEIDLPPTHCNLGGRMPRRQNPACIMCPRSSPEYTSLPTYQENHFWEILEKIQFLMPHLQSLAILGVAEPFLRNAVFDAFDALDYVSHQDHINFWTYSNGTIFGPQIQEKYQRYVKQSLLNFSIDAATPETYLKIRRHDLYEIVKRNVKRYSQNRDTEHYIKVCHNINKINFREMPQMVEEAAEMEVDGISFNFTHSGGGYVDLKPLALTEKEHAEYQKCERRAKELGESLKIRVGILRTFNQNLEQL